MNQKIIILKSYNGKALNFHGFLCEMDGFILVWDNPGQIAVSVNRLLTIVSLLESQTELFSHGITLQTSLRFQNWVAEIKCLGTFQRFFLLVWTYAWNWPSNFRALSLNLSYRKNRFHFFKSSYFGCGSQCFLLCIMRHIDDFLIVVLSYNYRENTTNAVLNSLCDNLHEKAFLFSFNP